MNVIRILRHRVYRWEGSAEPARGQQASIVVPITNENVHRVLEFREPRHLAVFEGYLREGRFGVFAIRNGRVLGHAWVSRPHERMQTLNRYFRLRPGDTLIHYCNVDPSVRGHGLYGAMLRELAGQLSADKMVKRILIDTERSNTSSMRGIEKEQFIFVSSTWYLLVGKLLVLRVQKF